MPGYVASIEVYFTATDARDADQVTDIFADAIADGSYENDVTITAVTSGCTPDPVDA